MLSPDEDALFVTLPDFGRVLRLPIIRCAESATDCNDGLIDESGITSVSLDASMTKVEIPKPTAHPSYQELCGYSLAAPPAAHPIVLPADAFTMAPRPSALMLDAYCSSGQSCVRKLLVADEALPVIHAIDVDAAAADSGAVDPVLAPLVTGVPTQAIAVTPPVPATLDGTAETHYVYAIDATDGSVLVLEDGQVLNVSEDPNGRPDRLALGSVGPAQPAAEALAVLTPGFDPIVPFQQQWIGPTPVVIPTTVADSLAVCTDAATDLENPARLRGVFLAVALSDGTVPIVDIHDLELRPQKSGRAPCRPCVDGIPNLARNHVRVGVTFVPQTGATQIPLTPIVSSLSFQVQTLSYDVRTDGTSGTLDAPGLDCIKCDSDQVAVFPPPVIDTTTGMTTTAIIDPRCADRPALLCAPDDPWVARELWRATY
ncbi:MAG: hypothetical protein ACHQDE_07840, partial [Acidimicrobiia bacterium]